MPAETEAVSIIVACRNERRCIERLILGLLAQDLAGYEWEAIIADGMSDDGTREILFQWAAKDIRIRVIDNPGQIVSTGLNRAIRQAKGKIVIRMDSHTEYAPDYVRCCVDTLRATGAQNVGGPARTRAEGYLGTAIAAAYHSRFACGGARFHDESYEGELDTVTYGCWWKDTLEQIGLFDEDLVRNQDDELNLRIIRAGGRIWQTPRLKSWYYPRTALRSLSHQYFQYGFWKVPVIHKHHLPASWRHLVPGAFVMENLVFGLGFAVAALLGWDNISWGALAALTTSGLSYVCACLAASLAIAHREGWKLLPILPLVFATYHLSYGLGFLVGAIWWPWRQRLNVRPGTVFTQITH